MSISANSLLLPTAATVALATGLLILDSKPARACGAEPTIGEICYFSYNWCPNFYLPAAGQSLPVSSYQALYSLIGNIYGNGTGSSNTTFNLPDLRGRSVVGTGQGPGLSNVQLGAKRGQESVTLNSAQVPLVTHTHTATFTGTGGGGGTPLTVTVPVAIGDGNASTVANGQTVYPAGLKVVDGDGNVTYSGPYTTTAPAAGAQGKIVANTTGGGGITGGTVTVNPDEQAATQAVSTLPPQLAQTACIAVNGLYPQRP